LKSLHRLTEKKRRGDRLSCGLSPFYFSLSGEACATTPTRKLSDFIGETGTHRDRAEKESWN
jgi:hypothetical protein